MSFSPYGALLSLLLLLFSLLYKNEKKEKLLFPTLKPFQNLPKSLKLKYAPLPKKLYFLSFLLFCLSLWDLKVEKVIENLSSKEGIALFLVLDTSRSMDESSFYSRQVSKLEELKKVATSFVKKRPQDLIGLIGFSRGADVLSPLTLNHSFILDKIATLSSTKSTDQQATAIGYALLKTLNLIETTEESNKNYDIKSKVIVLVTDGLENPYEEDLSHPLRSASLEWAGEKLKNAGIKLYIINLEADFTLKKSFELQKKRQLSTAQKTGGDALFISGDEQLETLFEKLNALEKSPLPKEKTESLLSLTPFFLSLSLFFLVCSFILENTYLKRCP